MKSTVAQQLREAGYSEAQIEEGIAHADQVGWQDVNELGQLALSHILYRDQQLADGDRAPAEEDPDSEPDTDD
jgi:hypothetical protein